MADKPAIILPLDGSGTATKALGTAQAVAKIMGAILYIVHVAEVPMSEADLIKKLKIGQIGVKDFSIHQIIGSDVVDGILRFAAGIDTRMIVMSSHGWTFNEEHLLGAVTMGIAQRAISPVMIIRPDMPNIPDIDWRPQKLLVPQDGSPTAAVVMIQVFNLAKSLNTVVDVLNIGVVGEKAPTEEGTIIPPRYLDHPRYDWPAWATEFVERFYAHRPPEVELRLFEREGEPADVILKFAADNRDDFIAIGWHGHLEERRAEIVKDLLQRADLPILLIWTRE